MVWTRYAVALMLAYLLGATPVGYLITWVAKKIDIRTLGSGHTGGTNVLRVAGALPAILTVLCDFGKGYAAVALARFFLPGLPLMHALAGAFAVVGHDYSIFLGFKGGVGSMTTLGGAAALMFPGALVAGLLAIVIIALWRYASLGSLSLVVTLPLFCLVGALLGAWPATHLIFALVTAALSGWALRTNARRLRQGTERKLGQSVPPGQSDVAPEPVPAPVRPRRR